jgi:hypothetical protein
MASHTPPRVCSCYRVAAAAVAVAAAASRRREQQTRSAASREALRRRTGQRRRRLQTGRPNGSPAADATPPIAASTVGGPLRSHRTADTPADAARGGALCTWAARNTRIFGWRWCVCKYSWIRALSIADASWTLIGRLLMTTEFDRTSCLVPVAISRASLCFTPSHHASTFDDAWAMMSRRRTANSHCKMVVCVSNATLNHAEAESTANKRMFPTAMATRAVARDWRGTCHLASMCVGWDTVWMHTLSLNVAKFPGINGHQFPNF